MKYTLSIKETMSIRAGHGVAFEKIASLTPNTSAGGDELWNCTADGKLLNAKVGDQWIHITTPIDGWVAVVHAGVVYGSVTVDQPPPVSGQFPQKFKLTNVETNESAEYVRA